MKKSRLAGENLKKKGGMKMKKGLILVVSLVMIIAVAGLSHAGMYTAEDIVEFNGGSGEFMEFGGGSQWWTHQLNFVIPNFTIYGAKLIFDLRDDNDSSEDEFVNIWTEGIGWESPAFLSGSPTGDVSSGNNWQYYNIDYPSLLDGYYDVGLESGGGDVNLISSRMVVEYAPVPEPATVSLLGLGLVGVAVYRRKLKK
jgi:hypothetical protein